VETIFLALRVVVALGAVFGALLFAHRWITKGRPGSQPRNRQISVVARQGLGAKAGVAVVDAGGRRYLLGVTEHAVTVLDTLGPAEAPTGEPSLVAAQPITAAERSGRFEQEMRTVTEAIRVQGAITYTRPHPVAAPAPAPAFPSRRAMRDAEQAAAAPRRPEARGGVLAGSVLSAATWRQTIDALKKLR
jgi:flagellar protein FliO/FliZ